MLHEAAAATPATHHQVATTSGKRHRRAAPLQVCAPDTVWQPPSALTTPYGFCHRRPPHRQPGSCSPLSPLLPRCSFNCTCTRLDEAHLIDYTFAAWAGNGVNVNVDTVADVATLPCTHFSCATIRLATLLE